MTAPEVPHADLIASARTDISDADRCDALGITPAVHQLHRRLRQVTDALAALADTVSLGDYEAACRNLAKAERERDAARAERDALAAQLAELRSMHKAKHGESDHGPYIICDYDKTHWPCRTHMILDTAPAMSLALHDAEVWDQGFEEGVGVGHTGEHYEGGLNPYRAAAIREEVK